MEDEKLRRKQFIEYNKARQEKEQLEKQRQEEEINIIKNQTKVEFMKRLEEEQLLRAKLVAQMKENKRIALEIKNTLEKKESEERKKMGLEDKQEIKTNIVIVKKEI